MTVARTLDQPVRQQVGTRSVSGKEPMLERVFMLVTKGRVT
jgi:hypothetical protein